MKSGQFENWYWYWCLPLSNFFAPSKQLGCACEKSGFLELLMDFVLANPSDWLRFAPKFLLKTFPLVLPVPRLLATRLMCNRVGNTCNDMFTIYFGKVFSPLSKLLSISEIWFLSCTGVNKCKTKVPKLSYIFPRKIWKKSTLVASWTSNKVSVNLIQIE